MFLVNETQSQRKCQKSKCGSGPAGLGRRAGTIAVTVASVAGTIASTVAGAVTGTVSGAVAAVVAAAAAGAVPAALTTVIGAWGAAQVLLHPLARAGHLLLSFLLAARFSDDSFVALFRRRCNATQFSAVFGAPSRHLLELFSQCLLTSGEFAGCPGFEAAS